MKKNSLILTWVSIFCTFLILSGCDSKQAESIKQTQPQEGYVDIDQGRLFYKTFGTGTPIIMLHGGPGLDHWYLLPQLSQISEDHQIIFYDQRGSGRSLQTPMNETYINMDRFTQDLEELRLALGVDKFILAGHSFGGYLAMWYAVEHQENLAGLMLLNSAPMNYAGQKAFMESFVEKTSALTDTISPLFDYESFEKLSVKEIDEYHRILFSVYLADPNLSSELTFNFDKKSALSGFRVGEFIRKSAWMIEGFTLEPKLNKLKIPTLILHGNQDIIPEWTADDLHKAIPNSVLVKLDNCGHFPYIEKQEEMFAHIHTFLDQNKL